ncbi:MAG: hypothetical protein LBK60_01880 [Verrucomicrobiales bacterium]|jgi:hypothetical protein|nr:hypothetical protein [Verrucomicrobiales bacterium]
MALPPPTFSNRPSEEIIPPDSLIQETIEFVYNSLLPWSNDDALKGKHTKPERKLNGNLSDFLTISHRMIYFRHEQDEEENSRSVDIAAKPRETVMVSGRSYNYSQPILLIEAKRLPAPTKDREREYVTGENGEITGGIQRFKLGKHGKEHEKAIIVGYVQEQTPKDWYPIINGWIDQLANDAPVLWNPCEKLLNIQFSKCNGLAYSTSSHPRNTADCKSPTIQLHHFWIQLN